tara:strand:- start:79 stop:792 length:714 start_codon:yes stop_codon:yes gene_type:complete
MNNLTYLAKLKFFLVYIFFYLISTELAIGQVITKEILLNLENGLNKRDFTVIKKYFNEKESQKINNRFSKIIKDFPNSKWTIQKNNIDYADINISGSKIINGKEFIFQSDFQYFYSLENGKIKNGHIKNQLTTIRNDNNALDINFSIPNTVLTGTNYDIDIIVNNPLQENVIAGGIKSHEVDTIIKQTVKLEPLVSGGIFKVTRAPTKPGIQVWSGIIAHPEGLISFTKTVNIVLKK